MRSLLLEKRPSIRCEPIPARASLMRSKTRMSGKLLRRINQEKAFFSGSNLDKAYSVARFVQTHLPRSMFISSEEQKKVLFKRSAIGLMKRGSVVGPLLCIDRASLAISLLNANGVSAWLARTIGFDKKRKPFVHDFVEFEHQGKVFSMRFFFKYFSRKGGVIVKEGTAIRTSEKGTAYCFRGADSQSIGGVKDWISLKKFLLKFVQNPKKAVEREKKRLDALIKSGIIPPSVAEQISNAYELNKEALEMDPRVVTLNDLGLGWVTN